MQYEQYEQEVRDLQGLIEEAHRVIQDRPIPSSNIQELQAQILHHEVQYINSFILPMFTRAATAPPMIRREEIQGKNPWTGH